MKKLLLLCVAALTLTILRAADASVGSAAGAYPQDPAETITVEAVGIGSDRAAALEQALQAAIMSAVGGIVESETIVENEQLVKDRMRQLSGGVIQRYEVLFDQKAAESHVVRVKAVISRKPIVDAVGQIVEGSAKVSGKSLLAKRKSAKRAEGDLIEALVPHVRSMTEAPFTVHLSEDAFINAVGLKVPENEKGLLAPVMLSIDLDRWNTRAATLVERLTAFGAPIESAEFSIRSWSLRDKAAQKEVELLNEQLKGGDPDAVEAAVARGGPAVSWVLRVIAEAATPVLRAELPKVSDSMPYGYFTVSGFLKVQRGSGIDLVDRLDGFSSDPNPTPAVIGVVHAVESGKARLSYFRVGAAALTELRRRAVQGARIEIALVDDADAIVASDSCRLAYRSGPERGVFLRDGMRTFAGGGPEPVLLLVPGGCEFGTSEGAFDMSTATIKPVKVGGSQGFDTEWFALLHFDFTESEIDRSEEIRVRCVPADAAKPSR